MARRLSRRATRSAASENQRNSSNDLSLSAGLDYLRLEPRRVLAVTAGLNPGDPEILEIKMDAVGDGAKIEIDGADLVVTDNLSTEQFRGTAADIDRVDVKAFGAATGTVLEFFDSIQLAGFDGLSLKTEGIDQVLLQDSLQLGQNALIADATALVGSSDGGALGTGSLTVAGELTIDGATTDVDLTNTANDFSVVSAEVNSAKFFDSNDVQLDAFNVTGDLQIQAAGNLLDIAGADLKIGGAAAFTADGEITLADDAADKFAVTGQLDLQADDGIGDNDNNNIAVGQLGDAQLGLVSLTTVDGAFLKEQGTIELGGNSMVGELSLEAETAGSDIIDASGAKLDVTGPANFIAANSILLNDQAGDELLIDGDASFAATAGTIQVGGDGLAELAGVNFQSNSNVDLLLDSSVELFGDNAAGQLLLQTTAGNITDRDLTSIAVAGDATFNAANGIALADFFDAGTLQQDTLNVAGRATFIAAGAIEAGINGEARFGSLTFNSTDHVRIRETGNLELVGTSQALSLELTAVAGGGETGKITDAATAEVLVGIDPLSPDNTARLQADDTIVLADDATNKFQIEDRATFVATAGVDVGSLGIAQFGELQFDSLGHVVVLEQGDLQLGGVSNAASLELTAVAAGADTGQITDAADAEVTVSGDPLSPTNTATFLADAEMVLADEATNLLDVEDLASFTTVAAIDIGSLGTARFGQLQFESSAQVEIRETGDMELAGVSRALELELTAVADGTEAGDLRDADGTELRVDDDILTLGNQAKFIADGQIELADEASNILLVDDLATFQGTEGVAMGALGTAQFGRVTFTSDGLVEIRETGDLQLTGVSTAGKLDLTATAFGAELGQMTDASGATVTVTGDPLSPDNSARFSADDVIVLADEASNTLVVEDRGEFSSASNIIVGQAGEARFGELQFDSTKSVNIRERGDMRLAGTSQAGQLSLSTVASGGEAGDITDATGTKVFVDNDAVTVGNNAQLFAAGAIEIADQASDQWIVDTLALFFAADGINVGASGEARFGQLNFSSSAAVDIRETGDMLLVGTSTAGQLELTAVESGGEAGSIEDATGAVLQVDGDPVTPGNPATLNADGVIELADQAIDVVRIDGTATFNGQDAVTVGQAGVAQFGSLAFNSQGQVTITEQGNMRLTDVSTADSLTLHAVKIVGEDGNLTDATGTQVTVDNQAKLQADTSIRLSDQAGDEFLVGLETRLIAGDSIRMGNGGIAQLTRVNFDGPQLVDIRSAGDTQIFGTNKTQSLEFTTIAYAGEAGDLSDATGTKILVDADPITPAGDARLVAAGKLTLTDHASDQLLVDQRATLGAGNELQVGQVGLAQFGSLTIEADQDAFIRETGDILLEGESHAGSLELKAIAGLGEAGKIEDLASAKLLVDGDAGTSGNQATFLADAEILLADEATNQLLVDEFASFQTDSTINLGTAGEARFGTLNFQSDALVTVRETGDMQLGGLNQAPSVLLTTVAAGGEAGDLTDAANTELLVDADPLTPADNATFNAAGAITLADQAADRLIVDGTAVFLATNGVAVGAAGEASFGQLRFDSCGVVSIRETGDMFLSGTNAAGRLFLTAVAAGGEFGNITDLPNMELRVDSTVCPGTSPHNATFTADGLILLADQASDKLFVEDRASFESDANDDNPAIIAVGQAGDARFGSLNFNGNQSVVIRETGNMRLTGTNSADELVLISEQLGTQTGSLTDTTSTDVAVNKDVLLFVDGSIELADQTSDTFHVGERAFLLADVNDSSDIDHEAQILVGKEGDARFGSLRFLADRSVAIRETGDMQLEGFSRAGQLELTSVKLEGSGGSMTQFGSITDLNGAQLKVDQFDKGFTDNFAIFEADGNVELANQLTNQLLVADHATFIADSDDSANDSDTDMDQASRIRVGLNAEARFGSLSFDAPGDVRIRETGDMHLRGTSRAYSLQLQAIDEDPLVVGTEDGSIFDHTGTVLTVDANPAVVDPSHTARFFADAKIELGDHDADRLTVDGNAKFDAEQTITVGLAGQARFGTLTFAAEDQVNIRETGNMRLSGRNEAPLVILTAVAGHGEAGAITDAANTQVLVNQAGATDATFVADGGIRLTDRAADLLVVNGRGTFRNEVAGGIQVGVPAAGGTAGEARFGELNFQAVQQSVSITETGNLDYVDVNQAGELTLRTKAGGDLNDLPLASLVVTGDALFDAEGKIELGDTGNNRLVVRDNANFQAEQSIRVQETSGSGSELRFGTLSFASDDNVVIQEDGNLQLGGNANRAGNLWLITEQFGPESGNITDAEGTALDVSNNATFVTVPAKLDVPLNDLTSSDARITLADQGSDRYVVGNRAEFDAADGINVGARGDARFGRVNFNSQLGGGANEGDVSIRETDDLLITGVNRGTRVSLESAGGDVLDDAATRLKVTEDAVFTADESIRLADQAGDQLQVGGLARFAATGTINVGDPAATTEFGTLSFDSVVGLTPSEIRGIGNPGEHAVEIYESDAMRLAGQNTATQLRLETGAGSISDDATNQLDVARRDGNPNNGFLSEFIADNGNADVLLENGRNDLDRVQVTARDATVVDPNRLRLDTSVVQQWFEIKVAEGVDQQRVGASFANVQANTAQFSGPGWILLGNTRFNEIQIDGVTESARPDEHGISGTRGFNPQAKASETAGIRFDAGRQGFVSPAENGIDLESDAHAVAIINSGTDLQVSRAMADGTIYIETKPGSVAGAGDLTVTGDVVVTDADAQINLVAGNDLRVAGRLINVPWGDIVLTGGRPRLQILDPNAAFSPGDLRFNSNRSFDPNLALPQVTFEWGTAGEQNFSAQIRFADFRQAGDIRGVHEYGEELEEVNGPIELTRRDLSNAINSLGSAQLDYDDVFLLSNPSQTNFLYVYTPGSINLFENGAATDITDLNFNVQAFTQTTARDPAFPTPTTERRETTEVSFVEPIQRIDSPDYFFEPTEFYELRSAALEPTEFYSLRFEDLEDDDAEENSRRAWDPDLKFEDIKAEILSNPAFPPGVYKLFQSFPTGEVKAFGEPIEKGITLEEFEEQSRRDQEGNEAEAVDAATLPVSEELDAAAVRVWRQQWQRWQLAEETAEETASAATGELELEFQPEADPVTDESTDQPLPLPAAEQAVHGVATVPVSETQEHATESLERLGTAATVGGALAVLHWSRRRRSAMRVGSETRLEQVVAEPVQPDPKVIAESASTGFFSKQNRRKRRTTR